MTVCLVTLGVCVLLALLTGVGLGHWIALRSLLLGVDSRHSRIPHRIAGQLYYVVPENEYCELTRLRYQDDESPGWP